MSYVRSVVADRPVIYSHYAQAITNFRATIQLVSSFSLSARARVCSLINDGYDTCREQLCTARNSLSVFLVLLATSGRDFWIVEARKCSRNIFDSLAIRTRARARARRRQLSGVRSIPRPIPSFLSYHYFLGLPHKIVARQRLKLEKLFVMSRRMVAMLSCPLKMLLPETFNKLRTPDH